MAAGSGQSVRFRVGRLSTPELEPLIVTNVRPTGREIGAGAYGSVVEVEIPGAQVAAKKLHDSLVQFGSAQQVYLCVCLSLCIYRYQPYDHCWLQTFL